MIIEGQNKKRQLLFYKEIDNINKTITKKAKEEAKSKLVSGMLQDPGFNRRQKLKLLDELILFTNSSNPEHKHQLLRNRVVETVRLFISKLKRAVARKRKADAATRSPNGKYSRAGFGSPDGSSAYGAAESPLLGALKLDDGIGGLYRRRAAKKSGVSTTVIVPRVKVDTMMDSKDSIKIPLKSKFHNNYQNPNQTCIFLHWILRTKKENR